MRGVVLTDTNDLDLLVEGLHLHKLGILKVRPGWGIRDKQTGKPIAWNDNAMRKATEAPRLILTTRTGDGRFLDAATAIEEVRPWYRIRPDLVVEIGNEPNRVDPGDAPATLDEIYGYRWHMLEAIRRFRIEMPQARIIMPGLIIDDANDYLRWYSVLGDLVMLVQYIGIHAYEWHNFSPPGTNQLARALKAANDLCNKYTCKPIMITELGINDVKTEMTTKVRRYRAVLNTLPGNVAGTMVYHICDNPIDADQRAYRIATNALVYLK